MPSYNPISFPSGSVKIAHQDVSLIGDRPMTTVAPRAVAFSSVSSMESTST